MDCDACNEAPRFEGVRRPATDGEASTNSAMFVVGVERLEVCRVGLTGVAATGLVLDGCEGKVAVASVIATSPLPTGTNGPSGLVSRVAVAVATESASVKLSAKSGSTTLLSAAGSGAEGRAPPFDDVIAASLDVGLLAYRDHFQQERGKRGETYQRADQMKLCGSGRGEALQKQKHELSVSEKPLWTKHGARIRGS